MRHPIAILVCLAAGACTNLTIPSEQGQLEVNLSDLRSERYVGHRASMPVLLGSTTAATTTVREGPATCFLASFQDAPLLNSITFDTPGPARFTFEPTGCPELPDAMPDALTLQVIPPDDLTGRVALPDMAYGVRSLDRGEATLHTPREVPDGFLPVAGEELVVVAGEATPLDVVLEHQGERVLVGPGAGVVEVTGPATFSPAHPLRGTLLPLSQGSGEIRFRTPQATVPVTSWLAVEPRDVRRLEAAFLTQADEDGVEYTGGLAAWGVDRQGRRVHGLPMAFEVVRGPLTLPDDDGFSWILYPADCTPPWELAGTVVERRVKLHYGGRTTRVDLSFDWTTLDPQTARDGYADWEPDPACVTAGSTDGRSGCGCAVSASTPLGGLGLLAVGLVAIGRRRRR